MFFLSGRDEFGLRAEWSGGVRAARKSLLLADLGYTVGTRLNDFKHARHTASGGRRIMNRFAHSARPGLEVLQGIVGKACCWYDYVGKF